MLSVCVLCSAQNDRGVIINEVMQSNIDCMMVDGDFPDSWIELYNPTGRDIGIGGYVIGEKRDAGRGYKLPENTKIGAYGHLLIFCDKENRGLHTDFRVDAGKADLYLFDNNGAIADSLVMDELPSPNVAYGRKTDGSAEWWYELNPTPGSANSGGGSGVILPNPVFSVAGGVYSGSLEVRISVPADSVLPDGTRLYITVDGSEPTEKSRYVTSEKMFVVTGPMCIRAKLMAPGCISPRAVTESYIIHPRKTSLPVISIVSDDDYFYGRENGILMSSINDGVPNYMRKWRRPVNIEYFDTQSGKTVLNQLAETAVSGVSTRESAQKSMKLYANKRFGKKNFKGAFWGDKPEVNKVKSFVLRNGGNNDFLSRINDALVQKLFGTNVDNLDWQAYQPVIVYLNGKYMGEYGMRERSDDNYVESNYDGLEDIETADETSYQNPVRGSLFASFREDYMRRDVTFRQLEEQMDMDNFIKSLAAEIYGQNTDFPTNNVSMWRPLDEGGKWRWILKDIDRFGVTSVLYPESFDMISYIFGPSSLQYEGMHHFDLYRKLAGFPEFRRRFVDCMTVYLGDFLKPELVAALMDNMDDEIVDELKETFAVYSKSFSAFNSANRNMKMVISVRNKYLYSQLSTFFGLGGVVSATVETGGMEVDVNDVRLRERKFEGSFFVNHSLSLRNAFGTHGWKMTVGHQDGTKEVHEFLQPEISVLLSDYQRNRYETLTVDFEPVETGAADMVNGVTDGATEVMNVWYDMDGTPAAACRRNSGVTVTKRRKMIEKQF